MFDRKITSQKLALDLGVTVVCVNRWKTNKKDIGLSKLISLCQYFTCSLDYLVGKSENTTRPNNFVLENFGTQVRNIMQERGISTYQLRKDTRYDGAYFYAWDKGSDPKLSTLIELANYFGCSLDELVGLE